MVKVIKPILFKQLKSPFVLSLSDMQPKTSSRFLSTFFLCFSLASCAGIKDNRISGTLNGAAGKTLKLEALTAAEIVAKDSAKLDAKGNFSFPFSITEPTFFRLKLSDNEAAMLILQPGENVTISGSADGFGSNYTVKGSPMSLDLQEANQYLQKNFIKGQELNQLYQDAQNNPKRDSLVEALTHTYERMMEDEAAFLKTFLNTHAKSLACLAVVEKLDKDRYLDEYQKLDASLSKALPKSAYVMDYHKRLEELARFAPGTLAPDIKLNTPEGQELALSSLRGKVVLLDFWASWCGPCRRENPNVVRIYNRFKEKGFTVYSVSLDKNKGNWTEAIQKDRLTWSNHVSDLGYWNSSVVPLYKIEGIPLTFLLDKEGKIVAKGLRDKELENKVAELLSR